MTLVAIRRAHASAAAMERIQSGVAPNAAASTTTSSPPWSSMASHCRRSPSITTNPHPNRPTSSDGPSRREASE